MKLPIAALLLTAMQFAHATEPVGRIFFTPEQRAQLDSLRTQRVVASQVRDEPIPEIVTYNGIVRRADGKATVWVNGEALSEAGLRDKQSIAGRVGRDGRILLQTPQANGAAQVQLKVGQSAELLSGRVAEPFSSQRATLTTKTKPEPAAKPPATAAAGSAPAPRPPASERASEEVIREPPRDASAK
ncbi:MAG: hypothetical protein H6R21_1554 [Proteobacteria bacterium]|nr:hypothetical protein [Pseudomonadota bacterium]